ncbi:hypothetical protein [Aneurinibacillus migulanus]|uniref:Uncharacterized protein n=1 Tax=Aneurinibacillus migulanus TaxID=47500 RepID=A0A0D1VDR4_ANEMI|nr:hypothetical protein [Aneurinibacillus migulanus]KIV57559.1 hypothetical protein TS65_10110 [Aneurinibacillus migulanus]KON94821.1 hypothetical protein AF333_04315 [Aneurinibacillus migulanus]MCP1354763.1 hypothetical protein [Aneurinibacillus migulanus]MED0892923.1 hypothetical protein [Aneurinibacillus migulanus]MED1619169.1 hypothetical protein [Aneurinibacillus migulanus]
MILTLISVLFCIYIVLRIWIFRRQKEWKDLVVFTVVSGLACYFLFTSNLWLKSGALLQFMQQVTGSTARRMILVIFGVEL